LLLGLGLGLVLELAFGLFLGSLRSCLRGDETAGVRGAGSVGVVDGELVGMAGITAVALSLVCSGFGDCVCGGQWVDFKTLWLPEEEGLSARTTNEDPEVEAILSSTALTALSFSRSFSFFSFSFSMSAIFFR